MKFGIGQSVRRIEDRDLILGQGQFTDDAFVGEGKAVYFLRAPFAHARLTHLNLEPAKQAEGVRLVASQETLDADGIGEVECQYLCDCDGTPMKPVSKPPMIRDINRYAGDIVAMVVADTREQARNAAEAIEVDFEPLEAVTDVYAAMADTAPQLYAEYPNNIAFEWQAGRLAEAQAAIAEGANDSTKRIFSIDVVNSRVIINSMETRPMVARPMPDSSDGVQIWTGSQGVVGLAKQIAKALNLRNEQVQVLSGHVGGSFGFKIFLHPEQICIAWAARKLGVMLRWQQDRSEGFLSDLHGRDNRTTAQALVTNDGRIEALAVTIHANMGAWLSNFGVYIPTKSGSRTLTGCYDIAVAGLAVKGVMTNTPAVDAYRGAGRPEANYLLERLMDRIAFDLGIDRITIRQRNLIKPEQIPYPMVLGGVIDSGAMPELMMEAVAKADWAGFDRRRADSAQNGKKRGIGLAMYLEQSGGGQENDIELAFDGTGAVTVYASQHDNGQGHRTTLTQILSDTLGYDAGKITIIQGDSLKTPSGTTGGARMTAVLGSTVHEAGRAVLERAMADAATHLDSPADEVRFDDGVFTATASNRAISLEELVVAVGNGASPHPYSLKQSFATDGATYPYGCHIAEVEVDEATLAVRLVRFTVVDDFGVVINPLTLEGQIHGGIAQGVGQALYEHAVYDDDGQLLAGSLMDYTLPRADHLPHFDIYTRNTICQNNPLGVKGAGEAGAIGATPAVISAVCDALSVEHIDMPATPQRIWEKLRGG